MAAELGHSNLNLKHPKRLRRLRSSGLGFDAKGAKYLIVKLPSPRIVTILFLSMLLACLIISFPWFRSVLGGSVKSYGIVFDDPINSEMVPELLNDLANEGLLITGYKALFLIDGDDGVAMSPSVLRDDIDMDVVHVTDFERQSSIQEDTFDFVFTCVYGAASAFIDRTLKMGGVLAIQLSQDPSEMFEVPMNYRIVYFRKFESPVLAMKRLEGERGRDDASAGQRRLMGMALEEEKKAALRNLEDVLLEPPRSASRRSSRYLKKTRYLPDLMGDRLALEMYPRRVFIDVRMPEKDSVGSSSSRSNNWFARNYPTRNLDFEKYTINTVGEEGQEADTGGQDQGGMSEWLRGNVREEEYVVMKAEAEVVEEMVRSRAIRLVDELFLECKPRGSGRRAYWECLALYGRLRDEGIAVHQWWG